MNQSRQTLPGKTPMTLRAGAFALAFLAACPVIAAPTPEDLALSEALFREGKTLLQEGKFDAACPKLAESHRLDPAGGTLITLGLCYEGAGKTASAWVVFSEALSLAERDKRADRIKLSKEHIATLENKLSYLTIELAPEGVGSSDFLVTRDGANVARAALGTASAVDPGKHVIKVSAAGFTPYVVEVDVGLEADRKKVVIPPLVREPEKPVEPPPPVDKPIPTPVVVEPPPKEQSSGRMHPGRIAAISIGAVSAVSLGVGAYFGSSAKSDHDEAIKLCPQSPCPSSEGIQRNESAKESASVATGLLVAGGVGLAAGVVLWLVSPSHVAPAKPSVPRVSFVPVVRPGGAAAFVVGSF